MSQQDCIQDTKEYLGETNQLLAGMTESLTQPNALKAAQEAKQTLEILLKVWGE